MMGEEDKEVVFLETASPPPTSGTPPPITRCAPPKS